MTEPFQVVSGVAAALLMPNIDTDTIIPKQFLKGIDRSGLRDGFLFDLRFNAFGKPRSEFILNRPEWAEARFLIVGPNFGCGSSREHAVWALQQLGVRALIGTSYGSIFRDNCLRNGVLAVSLHEHEVAELAEQAGHPSENWLTIDLPAQTVTPRHSGRSIRFDIESLPKRALETGSDAVSSTMRLADKIRSFEVEHHAAFPWLA